MAGTADKPIPAFYCCYLLRSKNRKSYYIGSTPNPARRLGQHNGSTKGGAKRTSMQGKRPWEMTAIVTGFPSNVAALQFEWAWQNTHATRHIDRQVRDARVEELQKKKRNGSPHKRSSRPPMSLEARLKNLHHLLMVKSFGRWPLHVRFFAPDVFETWEKHLPKLTPKLRDSISIRLTPAIPPDPVSGLHATDQLKTTPSVIRDIQVAYEDSKSHVEKAIDVISHVNTPSCEVCRSELCLQSDLFLICPLASCRSLAHLSCLSKTFLDEQGNNEDMVPIEGTCPSCRSPLKWSTLIKELSLRMRGQKEIEVLLKPKRKSKIATTSTSGDNLPELPTDDEDNLDETWMQDVEDEHEAPSHGQEKG